LQEEKTILGRLGTPDEIAAAAAFLLSEDASYLTAETLVVAGGMNSKL
jgi:dehydrogenase/reductase SDR family protein 4